MHFIAANSGRAFRRTAETSVVDYVQTSVAGKHGMLVKMGRRCITYDWA